MKYEIAKGSVVNSGRYCNKGKGCWSNSGPATTTTSWKSIYILSSWVKLVRASIHKAHQIEFKAVLQQWYKMSWREFFFLSHMAYVKRRKVISVAVVQFFSSVDFQQKKLKLPAWLHAKSHCLLFIKVEFCECVLKASARTKVKLYWSKLAFYHCKQPTVKSSKQWNIEK